MMPHTTIRKGKGFCCEWDDGPYKKWAKRHARVHRKRDRQRLKKELTKEVQYVKVRS